MVNWATQLTQSSIFYLFSFFVSYSPSSLNGTQPKPATCPKVIAIWKCLFDPLQIGGPKTTFIRRLRNWTATSTADVFRI